MKNHPMTDNIYKKAAMQKEGEPMKRVIAGCIDLTLEFDSVEECNNYADSIRAKHQTFNVLKYDELPGGRIRVRIQRQYNNSPFPVSMEGGEKSE